MDTSIIDYEVKDQIAYITMNREEKLNTLNQALINGLNAAWKSFERDSDARVAIVSGAGKNFGAGLDVSSGTIPDYVPCLPGIGVEVAKPTIASVRGYCFGLSMSLAMRCDLKVISENTQFGFPEVRLGFAGLGSDVFAEYLPLPIALEIALTGEGLSAQKAYELGFVNRVSADEQVMNVAIELAQKMKILAPLTLKALKALLYERALGDISRVRRLYTNLIEPQLDSKDFKEGQAAFKEKRQPHFNGI